MNDQLQARIQAYVQDGKSSAWIANHLFADDQSIDYDAVRQMADGLIETSKKKEPIGPTIPPEFQGGGPGPSESLEEPLAFSLPEELPEDNRSLVTLEDAKKAPSLPGQGISSRNVAEFWDWVNDYTDGTKLEGLADAAVGYARSFKAGRYEGDMGSELFGAMDGEGDFNELAETMQSVDRLGLSEGGKRIEEKLIEADKNGAGFWDKMAIMFDGSGAGLEIVARSLGQMAGSATESGTMAAMAAAGTATAALTAGAGATVGSIAGPGGSAVGGVAGAIGGFFKGAIGGLSGAVEAQAVIMQGAREELATRGLELNGENLEKIFNDEAVVSAMRSKALVRGVTIAVFDSLTSIGAGRAVGALAKTGKVTKSVSKTAVSMGVEGVGASLGEATAQMLDAGEIDLFEVALEGIAELPMGTFSLIGSTVPSYRINGKKVSGQDVEQVLASGELADNIEVKRDSDLSDRVAKRQKEQSKTKGELRNEIKEEARKQGYTIDGNALESAVRFAYGSARQGEEDGDMSRRNQAILDGLDQARKKFGDEVAAVDYDNLTVREQVEAMIGSAFSSEGIQIADLRKSAAKLREEAGKTTNKQRKDDLLNQAIDFEEAADKRARETEPRYTKLAIQNPKLAKALQMLDVKIYNTKRLLSSRTISAETREQLEKQLESLAEQRTQLDLSFDEKASELSPAERTVSARDRAKKALADVKARQEAAQKSVEELSNQRYVQAVVGDEVVDPDEIARAEADLIAIQEEAKAINDALSAYEEAKQAYDLASDPLGTELEVDVTAEEKALLDAANTLNSLLGIDETIQAEVEAEATEWSAEAQAENHFTDPSEDGTLGSTFTVDGKNQIGQKKVAVSIFNERGKILKGKLSKEEMVAALKEFREANDDILGANGDILSIGTYYDPESDQTFIDISAVVDRESGVKLGRQYNQESVFALDTFENIKTGGDGTVIEGLKPEIDRVQDIRDILAADAKSVENQEADVDLDELAEQTRKDVKEIEGDTSPGGIPEGAVVTPRSKDGKSNWREGTAGLTAEEAGVLNRFQKLADLLGIKIAVYDDAEVALKVDGKSAVWGGKYTYRDGQAVVHINPAQIRENQSLESSGGAKRTKGFKATVQEEFMHAVIGRSLNSLYMNDQKKAEAFRSKVEKIVSRADSDFMQRVQAKEKAYKTAGKPDYEVYEEVMIEMFSALASGEVDLAVIDKIRVAINAMLASRLGKDAKVFAIEDVNQMRVVLSRFAAVQNEGNTFGFEGARLDGNQRDSQLISPAALKSESGEGITVKFNKTIYKYYGFGEGKKDIGSAPQTKTFKDKWHFINWWKKATSMGTNSDLSGFTTASGQPIDVDRIKSYRSKSRDGLITPKNSTPAKDAAMDINRMVAAATSQGIISQDVASAVRGKTSRILRKDDASVLDTVNRLKSKVQGLIDSEAEQRGKKFVYNGDAESRASDILVFDAVTNGMGPLDMEKITDALVKLGMKRPEGRVAGYEAMRNYLIKRFPNVDDRKVYMTGLLGKYMDDPGLMAEKFGDEIPMDFFKNYHAEAQKAVKNAMDKGMISGSMEENMTKLNVFAALVSAKNQAAPNMESAMAILLESEKYKVDSPLGITPEFIKQVAKGKVKGADGMVRRQYAVALEKMVALLEGNLDNVDVPVTVRQQLESHIAKNGKFVQGGEIDWPNVLNFLLTEYDGSRVRVKGQAIAQKVFNYKVGAWVLNMNQEMYPSLRSNLGGLGDIVTVDTHVLNTGSLAIGKYFYAEGRVLKNFFELIELRSRYDGDRSPYPSKTELATLQRADAAASTDVDQRSDQQKKDLSAAGLIIKNQLQFVEKAMKRLDAEGKDADVRSLERSIERFENPNLSESLIRKRDVAEWVRETTATLNDTFETDYSASQIGQLIFADRQVSLPARGESLFDLQGNLKESKDYTTYAAALSRIEAVDDGGSDRDSQLLAFPMNEGKADAADSPLYKSRSGEQELSILKDGARITNKVVDDALSTDATSRRIIAKNVDVKEGQKVGIRLNLNVMKNTGIPVQTLHDKSASGEALKYSPAVMVKGAELYVNQNARKKIVTFQENKFPMASVNGEFMSANLDDMNFDGVKAFFNPFKHNVFVDAAGRPIKSAEEATIVGNTVYLRGEIEYYGFDDPVLEQGRKETASEKAKRIKRGPKYEKALKRFKGMAERMGVQFSNDVEVEAAYDNMPIKSMVALNESEVAENMEKAQERASTLLTFRRTAKRMSRRYPSVRKEIVENPNNYFTPQSLKDLKGDLVGKTDAELIGMMSGNGLSRLQDRNDDLGVLATAELINRAVARGDEDAISALVENAAAIGTTAGRLLRHLRELKSSSPAGLVAMIEGEVGKRGNKLSGEQKSRLETMAAEMFRLHAEHEDLIRRAIAGEDVEADLQAKTKEVKSAERRLDTFSNAVIERGWGEIAVMLIQGNLLTPMSQVTNVGANMVNALGKVAVDAIALPAERLINMFGIESSMKRNYSINAYMYGLRKFGQGFVESLDTIWTGQDSDVTEWRIHRGFAPIRSLMSAMGKGDLPLGPDGNVPLSQRAKLAVQGTLGIPAEAMFRFLSLGDTPFRRYVEGIELYHAGKSMGLEGEALIEFMKHPTFKAQEAASKEGRKLTFQERTAMSDFADDLVDFFERSIARGLDWIPGMDEQGAKSFAKFIVRTNMPYVRTPANMLIETLAYVSPYVAAPMIMKKLKDGDARGASQDFGKIMVGTMVAQTAITLIREGLLSGALDYTDDEERNIAYDQFPPNSINVSGLKRWIDGGSPAHQKDDFFVGYNKLGILGAVMGATTQSVSREQLQSRDQENFGIHALQDVFGLGAFSGITYMMDQSFMQGVSSLINVVAASDVDDLSKAFENWTKSTFQAVSAIALPNTLSALYRGSREYLPDTRVTKDMSTGERILTQMKYTIKDRTFGLSQLPVRVDWRGQPIKQTPRGANSIAYQLFDITKSKQGSADPVSNEIYRLYESTGALTKAVGTPGYASKSRINVPDVDAGDIFALKRMGYKYSWMQDEEFMKDAFYLNTTQINKVMEASGKERYNELDLLTKSDKYKAMSDEDRVEAMDKVNNNYNSFIEKKGNRFRNHTLVLFEIMQNIYEDERRSKD